MYIFVIRGRKNLRAAAARKQSTAKKNRFTLCMYLDKSRVQSLGRDNIAGD